MRCLLSYDIGDDKRRRKVVKRLQRCAHRVQFSVFEGEMTAIQWRFVWKDLEAIINPDKDGLLLVPICDACSRGRRESGQTSRVQIWEDEVV